MRLCVSMRKNGELKKIYMWLNAAFQCDFIFSGGGKSGEWGRFVLSTACIDLIYVTQGAKRTQLYNCRWLKTDTELLNLDLPSMCLEEFCKYFMQLWKTPNCVAFGDTHMHPLKLKVEELGITNKASAPVLNHFLCCKHPHSFPRIWCALFGIQTCGGLEKPQNEYGKAKKFEPLKMGWVYCADTHKDDEVIIMGRK